MTIDTWLENAKADAEKRGLADLKPLLETLAKMTESLRKADDELRASQTAGKPDERAK